MLMERCQLDVRYRKGNEPYLHPGRQAEILYNGETIGVLGELHPLTRRDVRHRRRAYVAEIRLQSRSTTP